VTARGYLKSSVIADAAVREQHAISVLERADIGHDSPRSSKAVEVCLGRVERIARSIEGCRLQEICGFTYLPWDAPE
jgi:hypothetical protein